LTAFRNETYTQDVNFDEYLQELADASQPLAISKLTQLSSMRADQASMFARVWREMELQRRRHLLQELTELTEDDVELNFDAVFLGGLSDRDAEIRFASIRGLREYEGRDLLDVLVKLLQTDANPAVRAEAALALGPYVLQAEFDRLRGDDSERIEQALEAAFRNAGEPPEVRGRALESLGARSAPWVRELIEEAHAGLDRVLRLSAVHAMGRSCDPAWLPELTEELGSDDAALRFEAAVALGMIGDEAAVPELSPLVEDEDVEVQEAAIGSLGQIGGERAKDALRGLIGSGDERLRESALAALAEIDFAEDPLGYTIRG
jgi:HEAT repeat protein